MIGTPAKPRVWQDWLPFLAIAFVCGVLLVRDTLRTPGGFELLGAFDLLVIVGIAWVPATLLLRIPIRGIRIPGYLITSGLALAWIVVHTPSHAVGPTAGAGTPQFMTATCTAGFALLTSRLASRMEPSGRPSPGWVRMAILVAAWAITGVLVALGLWALIQP